MAVDYVKGLLALLPNQLRSRIVLKFSLPLLNLMNIFREVNQAEDLPRLDNLVELILIARENVADLSFCKKIDYTNR